MNPRTKKYYQNRNEQNGERKGSQTDAGYNEQTQVNQGFMKKNPAPSKKQDDPNGTSLDRQDGSES